MTFVIQRELFADGTVTETRSITFTEKKKYTQNWPAYNAAQSVEKSRFQVLLADLCTGIAEPQQEMGRPRLPIRERLFAAILKTYSTFSSRRFASDLADAKGRGYVQNTMHYNQVSKYLQATDSTEALRGLVRRSALPLRAVETNFAVDSTGFSGCKFVKWFDEKWGKEKERTMRDWVKCHAVCGVQTGIVCDAQVTDRDTNDSPLLPSLVQNTARTFEVGEVYADKGYLGVDNVNAVHAVGGVPYIAPKIDSTGAAGGLFEKMVCYYLYRRDEFLRHYHQRSNIEAVFSSIKRKFGDAVRSKGETAMRNEVLCKLVCHNICTVIRSQMELGIEAEFLARA